MAEEIVRWSSRYSLGLDEIDEQHKALLDLINRTWQSIIDRSAEDVIFGLVEELEQYTLAHFAAEETFMRVMHYPNFDAHKKEHRKFVARIAAEKKRALVVGSLSLDLMHFLRDWLINHILVSDKAYADFTKQANDKADSALGRLFKKFF